MPGPPPPPPMNSGSRPPPGSPTTGLKPPRRSPLGLKSSTEEEDTDASKAKLKPFSGIRFNPTPTNHWFGIKSRFDEEQIETLFGCTSAEKLLPRFFQPIQSNH